MVTGMLGSGIDVDEVNSSFLLTDMVPEEREEERDRETETERQRVSTSVTHLTIIQ